MRRSSPRSIARRRGGEEALARDDDAASRSPRVPASQPGDRGLPGRKSAARGASGLWLVHGWDHQPHAVGHPRSRLRPVRLGVVAGSRQEAWRDSTPGPWDRDVQRFFDALAALDECLAAPDSPACPWTRLFQGPIADALTHIGQLALLRRLAGSPVRGENYFKADVVSGRVGPDQAAPRREFE